MVLVAGLGVTGQSVLRYLQLNNEKALAYDTRLEFDIAELQQTFPKVSFATGKLPKKWLTKITTLVLSPGISVRQPWVQALVQHGVEVIGDIELFARAVGVPVIAITGSNGKSTVTTLVGLTLEAAGYKVGMGGNIGLPALDLLSDEHEYEVYVLELSSFQLETTYSLHSISATLLNLSEDHMDRYDDLNAYFQAKLNVFNDTEMAICPLDLNCDGMRLPNRRFFGLRHSDQLDHYGLVSTQQGLYLGRGNQPFVAVESMALQGTHHQLNALALMALCEPFQLSPEIYGQVLSRFTGLAHRTQEIANQDGVRWINDSKGTNVGATLAAIESLGAQVNGKIVLIAGGVGKEADFKALAPAVKAYCTCVLLFGKDRAQIAATLAESHVEQFSTLEQAVARAAECAQPGDSVLFSPACASFDQFKNFEERGECYIQWVQQALRKSE